MVNEKTFAEKVIQFNKDLSKISMELPDGFRIINPFSGNQREVVNEITTAFYKKFYNDRNKRRLVLGSSPARRGTAVTGVPFEDAAHLQKETGILIDKFYINKSSSGFLYDVIEKYGGCKKFYTDFYMNFVCPIGIVRTNSKGNDVNCNYYESKNLQEALYSLIFNSIQSQIDFGIDTSVCYCIGSGENYNFLSRINKEYHFFKDIVPLEHPRFIMQYNSKDKDVFLKKYLRALKFNYNDEKELFIRDERER
ncbi:MAG: SMUG2 DNA glycosylase family protein [Clostridiales bacterium]|nr:SMUG2 DNA glycosylase family protein [Clostridiales bacterium]